MAIWTSSPEQGGGGWDKSRLYWAVKKALAPSLAMQSRENELNGYDKIGAGITPYDSFTGHRSLIE